MSFFLQFRIFTTEQSDQTRVYLLQYHRIFYKSYFLEELIIVLSRHLN